MMIAPCSARVSVRLAAAATIVLPLALAGQDRPDSSRAASRPLEAVVVTATRTEQSLKSLPAHVVVLGAPAIAASSAQSVPDLLRSIPGFTTRDFQSGMVAGPSQSMVSFRGLGGSSAGRALVLIDGIPAGDPFSGWLDWSRIPLPMLQSAEVVRGGSSTIWGSRSLGGVVNLRTIDPRRDAAQLTLEGGSLGTYHGTGAASIRRGGFSALLGGDFWNTDGFVILRKDQAGPVDARQATASRALSAKTTWDATPALQLWAGGGTYVGGDRPLFDEDYVRFNEARGGLRWLGPGGGIATVALFGNRRTSEGKSYTINSTRTAQTPQRYGDSPARSTGISLQWTQLAFARHEITAGSDVSAAEGSYDERHTFVADRATRSRDVSGKQQIMGVFLQDAADLGAGVRMVASLRADRVANTDGRRVIRDLDLGTVLSDTAFRDAHDGRLTYSFGLRWQATGWMGWRANVYEAFRAPSMYEMYYPRFSSRGTVTEANAALDAERLNGMEAGIDLTPGKRLLSRVTVYRNRVASPIMDVTIGTAGAQPQVIDPCGLMPARQTCSQRRNVNGLRSNGVETELEWRLTPRWGFGGGYSFSPTHVTAPGQPVDGNWAIRAARHTVTSNVRYDSPRWLSGALEVRHVGARYDDDLNEVKLDGFYLVGLRLNRSLGRGMTAHLKVENLLDEAFEIARTRAGLADMGAPRWITAGIRAAW
jgi:outer membrane cobalamin receptor